MLSELCGIEGVRIKKEKKKCVSGHCRVLVELRAEAGSWLPGKDVSNYVKLAGRIC